METIFMNSESSKANESHRFKLDLTDKLDLKDPKKHGFSQFEHLFYLEKHQVGNNNNKFEISAPIWNDTFDLPYVFYFIADIQDSYGFIIKKHETLTENLPVQICANKIKNRIIFKIKSGYKLELLTPETMRLLGCTKKGAHKDKDGDNVPKLESVEFVLVHCNLVKNDYQHTSHQRFYLLLFQTNNLES